MNILVTGGTGHLGRAVVALLKDGGHDVRILARGPGTKALLEAAEKSTVHHFVHVSIVGLEQSAMLPYSRVKLEAEDIVRASAVPWSIVRAAPFYWLLDRMLAKMVRGPLVVLPRGVSMEPVDSDDFAECVAECVETDDEATARTSSALRN